MSEPSRFISGFTQSYEWQPLGNIGVPNPFFYAVDADDFTPWRPGGITITATGNGTVAPTPGVGGLALFTTNSSTPAGTDLASIQRPNSDFEVPTALTSTLAFCARIMLPDVLNPQFTVGWLNTTTTPFAPTDGIYFNKASGSTVITCNVLVGSASKGSFSLNGIFTPTNSVFFDLGWQFEPRTQEFTVFAGVGLIGNKTTTYNTATLGPVGRFTASAYPTVGMNPTLALQSGTATSKTMQADFFGSFLER